MRCMQPRRQRWWQRGGGVPAVVFRHFGRSESRCGLCRNCDEYHISKIACSGYQAHRSMRVPSMMSVRTNHVADRPCAANRRSTNGRASEYAGIHEQATCRASTPGAASTLHHLPGNQPLRGWFAAALPALPARPPVKPRPAWTRMVRDLMSREPDTTPHAIHSDERPSKLVTATVVKFYDNCRNFYDAGFYP